MSNCEVWQISEHAPLSSVILKRKRLMLFGHLVKMDEWVDAGRILTTVCQSDWKSPAGCRHTSWLATLKNSLSVHNLSVDCTGHSGG